MLNRKAVRRMIVLGAIVGFSAFFYPETKDMVERKQDGYLVPFAQAAVRNVITTVSFARDGDEMGDAMRMCSNTPHEYHVNAQSFWITCSVSADFYRTLSSSDVEGGPALEVIQTTRLQLKDGAVLIALGYKVKNIFVIAQAWRQKLDEDVMRGEISRVEKFVP
ncbi:MAG: hypothetical protein JWN37_568 [Candidatus Nomurabacteria bacterium]|nr:hypothetical protein [Candidatus Nomurabacteria bacterium]